MKRLSVIGAGKVGRTLARLWHAAGHYTIVDLACASRASTAAAIAFVGAGRPVIDLADLEPADLLLIALPDDRIAATAATLAGGSAARPGVIAWHCSGALPADALAPLAAHGVLTAAAHPMHSFADPARSLDQFAGSWCALDGHPAALAEIGAALRRIGAHTVTIDSAAKPLYHAGGVLACNFLVSLLERAAALVAAGGIPHEDALRLLEPLVRATVDNLFATGPEAALTGPIARGDTALVARQLAAVVAHDADDGSLYRVLGRATLALARRTGRLDGPTLDALAASLAEPVE